MNKPVIVIPSYNPDETLIQTIETLRERGFGRFVVVNDGSRAQCAAVFEQVADMPGVHYLVHAVNMGKGRAMKTAFNYVLWRFPGSGCIVCDADGQHPADSVEDVARAMGEHPGALVLGVRRFLENKDMPRANFLGNQITRFVFFMITGVRYADTQCGLRGYPAGVMAQIMACAGERFEYENTMLLAVRRLGIPLVQVGMPAIYQEEGKYVSHFNRVRDSARIYRLLAAHAAAPLLGALVSLVLTVALLNAAPGLALGPVQLAAPLGYLAGWLVMLAAVPAGRLGRAVPGALGLWLGSSLLYGLLMLLLPAHPMVCWWIAAPFTAAAGQWGYLALREGRLPENRRVDY